MITQKQLETRDAVIAFLEQFALFDSESPAAKEFEKLVCEMIYADRVAVELTSTDDEK
jgi:hypothetical protein